jgi:hypothetical protein
MTILREAWRRHAWLTTLALLHVALLVALSLLALVDDVQVMGINRWIKPIKFSASIAIYFGSLAWFAPELGTPRSRRWPLAIAAASLTIEIIAITLQAARGTTSHYNVATLFDGAVFQVMGVAIVANTIAVAWCALLAWRCHRMAPSGYRLGITLGLVILLGASLQGGMMIAGGAHAVGVPDGGPGLMLVNWSTEGGDLRIAHFLGMHALQALPLVGFLTGTRTVLAVGAVWLAVATLALLQALAGAPLLRM